MAKSKVNVYWDKATNESVYTDSCGHETRFPSEETPELYFCEGCGKKCVTHTMRVLSWTTPKILEPIT